MPTTSTWYKGKRGGMAVECKFYSTASGTLESAVVSDDLAERVQKAVAAEMAAPVPKPAPAKD